MKKSIFEKIIAPVIVIVIGFFVLELWLKPHFFPPEPKAHNPITVDSTASPEIPVDNQGGEEPGNPSPGPTKYKNDPPPVKTRPSEPEPEKKYVYVTLTVDAAFSDAAILANGVQVAPVKSGLTIKQLEIEYTGNTIRLEVKSAQKTCEKLIAVPKDYFDNPTKISVTCTQ